MSKYRKRLPQLNGYPCITDGGLETTMCFQDGLELPEFAAFPLLQEEGGEVYFNDYFSRYLSLARARNVGFILESVTWRASADWGARLGYTRAALAEVNRKAVEMLVRIREKYETARTPIVISGNIGPRGDGYQADSRMTEAEAESYHSEQIAVFSETEADMVSGFTLNYVEEAIGIARAAKRFDIPAVISFTVETDGRLPTGETLREAITRVDKATGSSPAYYMINCAHPTHFHHVISVDEPWLQRIAGIRANASARSHEELDNSEELDTGNPQELGIQYLELKNRLSSLTVFGGCCGTDHRHVEAISAACL